MPVFDNAAKLVVNVFLGLVGVGFGWAAIRSLILAIKGEKSWGTVVAPMVVVVMVVLVFLVLQGTLDFATATTRLSELVNKFWNDFVDQLMAG